MAFLHRTGCAYRQLLQTVNHGLDFIGGMMSSAG
ncbi:Uncharacterised protein [Vibrio cholerae]|nr:Uncharacterised protein [Vibrio cholerae]